MKIISKERVFDKFFAVEKVEMQYKNDSDVVTRYYVDKVQGAGILLLNTETNKVILTRQFRIPLIDKEIDIILEVPAGVVDKNEKPEVGILREVREETGYEIKEVKHLYTFYTSPGYNNEEVLLFYGEVCNADKKGKGGGLDHEHEHIEVEEYSPEECFEMMEEGKFPDAKTLIGLLWLKARLKNKS